MRPGNHQLSISAVRADALFVSALQRSDEPTSRQVRQAVATAVCAYGGQGCAERVAQEFGEHPEVAGPRMRWACQLAGAAFGSPGARPAPAGPLRDHPMTHAGRAA